MAAINTTAATAKLKKEVEKIKKGMDKETKALGTGLWLAMSNASIKKGTGKKPKPGSKRSRGADWTEGPDLKVTYKANGRRYESTAEHWLARLKSKSSREQYTDKNGKTRTRRVNPYNIIPLKNQKKPGVLFTNEPWRKGSKGALPYSWRGDGLANYYLREQWRSAIQGGEAEVRISPAVFKGENNNERVLRLLNLGGSTTGSRKLEGFTLYFWHNKATGKTDVGIRKNYSKTKPHIRMKGYNLKRQVLTRVNRALQNAKPSEISKQQWRQLGKGA
ncbi:MAG: hypothetical protein IJG38_04985 [Thermoguttaceae bacterium]|nr:hypothetical protein [Thermoguttaceae bacterium]